ncbi:SDH family Clp fold serine proteinase [Sanguibacter massiliensis]|uniref:SDH family Clp fold serine proteinase n=1 Tax=Sanguibacter massiliensis TaxID=1973217 RepID=UPI0013EDF338|nr:hypothetical protein [Sanguibacter massiliensis]
MTKLGRSRERRRLKCRPSRVDMDCMVDNTEEAEDAGAIAMPNEHECHPAGEQHDAFVLVVFQGGRRGPFEALERPLYDHVVDIVERVVPFGETRPHLDLWIDSPGGDAHAAYKLARYLRAKFEVVHVVVPEYAKSAATLLSLVGSEIYMGPGAELGPLDVQDLREGEARMHSTLATANAATTLFQDMVEHAVGHGPMLLQVTGLARDRAIAHMLDFAASFSRPLVEKLDPEEMLSAQTSLLLTLNYATRLLAVSHRDKVNPVVTAKALVTDYPTHGHVIDRTTARNELSLTVVDIERYSLGRESFRLLRRLGGQPFVELLDGPTIRQLCDGDEGDHDGADEADLGTPDALAPEAEGTDSDAEAKPASRSRRNRVRSGPQGVENLDGETHP